MDAQQVTQQMISFQKQSLDNVQRFWDLAQTQVSGTVDQLLDQATWIPEDNRRALDNWRTLVKKEQERFAAYAERGFSIYEKMFSPPTAPKTTKSKNTAADK
jgi:hypothetical protein